MKYSRAAFNLTLCMLLALPLFGQAKSAPASKAPITATESQPVVLRGGKLLTISHGVIENGVLVIEGGKISAVGAAASVAIPKNAKIIDTMGMTIYPGLIDSHSQLGLTEISSV